MALEEKKEKKIRIYKIASEYNLATDSIMDFLKKKGYEVKSMNSIMTEEMHADFLEHFKKDIEKAEKKKKKLNEFSKTRVEKKPEIKDLKEQKEKESAKETRVEEASIVDEKKSKEAVVIEEEIPETKKPFDLEAKEEVKAIEVENETSKFIEEEIVEIEKVETKDETEVIIAPSDITRGKKEKPFLTRTEELLAKSKKGLKVIGKMDLNKSKIEAKTDETKSSEHKVEQKEEDATDKKDKKKKRKKIKTLKKTKDESPDSGKTPKKKMKLVEIDKREVDEAIKKTLLSLEDSVIADRASLRKKKKKQKAETHEKLIEQQREIAQSTIKVTEYIAVNELANLMNVSVSDVIQKCIGLGIMVSINQRLDFETITLVADEFGFQVELVEEYTSENLEDHEDDPENLKPRPPVVTIMGHVDHGKTSLLDKIRSTNVVAGESGGITQHIGAYQVDVGGGKYITFLDTPGHEAFTAMRARGAKATDIVVLVVAADDAVMPQTVEAIDHAQAAGVPIIIAINKIDKPGANIDKIRQQLGDRNILVEDWGGKYQCVQISAKNNINIDVLLEKILLEAEVLELKANPDRKARGIIIESQLDKGRGITATVLVQKGTLSIGDPFVAGNHFGRVRAMFDERNNKIEKAYPSTPVLVLGFEGAPQAGDNFVAVDSEREARETSLKRLQLKREQDQRQVKHLTLDEVARQISVGGVKELPLIVKGDVDGSVEALADSFMKLSTNEVVIRVIHKSVGQISESDVLLAVASRAIIIGFHVRPNLNARKLAETEKIDIRLYNVIYDAINEVKSALEGLLSPIISEEIVGTLEVRETFKVPKIGTVAGCYVQDGKISRQNKARIIRDGVVVFEGEIHSLKRFKDDVKEVDAGYECGVGVSGFNDIKIGDSIESFKLVETKKKLD